MDFNHYCKHCGTVVETEYGKTEYTCGACGETSRLKDLVPGWIREARIAQLKAMHTLMCNANDEGIYGSWIYTMPDEPNEDDFIDIAMDAEQYNECFDKFVKLIKYEGNRW